MRKTALIAATIAVLATGCSDDTAQQAATTTASSSTAEWKTPTTWAEMSGYTEYFSQTCNDSPKCFEENNYYVGHMEEAMTGIPDEGRNREQLEGMFNDYRTAYRVYLAEACPDDTNVLCRVNETRLATFSNSIWAALDGFSPQ